MFYACHVATMKKLENMWYVNSGCRNHMTSREDLLVDIDKRVTAKVEIGTRQLVDVVGKGNLVV